MKKSIVLLLTLLLLIPTAFAEGWGDLFGGLTSLLSVSDGETYTIGEIAETDDLTLRLINVMNSKGNSYYKPEDGMEYIILEFEVTNKSSEALTLSTMMNFTAWCDNKTYTIDLEALATAMLSGKYQLDCAVEAGKKVTGVIGYMIPSEWEEVKIDFKQDVVFGEKIVFVIEK